MVSKFYFFSRSSLDRWGKRLADSTKRLSSDLPIFKYLFFLRVWGSQEKEVLTTSFEIVVISSDRLNLYRQHLDLR
jgi:hypothetical protein